MKIWSFYIRETEPELLGDSTAEQIDAAIPRKAYRSPKEARLKAKEELDAFCDGEEELESVEIDWQETDDGEFHAEDPRSCLEVVVFPIEID